MANKKLKRIILTSFLFSSLLLAGIVYAEDLIKEPAPPAGEFLTADNFNINLSKKTAAKGYTVNPWDSQAILSFGPEVLNGESKIDFLKLNEDIPATGTLARISPIYQIEIANKAAYDNKLPIVIQLKYDQSSSNLKQVYFFDKNYGSWRPVPTTDYPDRSMVRAYIHLPFARVAVLADPEIMSIGKASWYKHKGGLYAASPDFAAGTRLRVVNMDNDKFVDVVVNDYGPDRVAHPERVLDLDKVAFARLSELSGGTVNVKIEPLENINKLAGKVLGVAETSAPSGDNFLNLTAKAACLVNEKTGEYLYDKNSTAILPLASLTKLVAIKIFLDTKPDLDKIVEYDIQDEEYNYEYVAEKWEAARLKISAGEKLTVENLLYAALVGSANNSVESLVRASGLPRDRFIMKMNEEVRAWGADSTRFIEPTGLSPQNVSSCRDYAIITQEVYKNPLIQKISATTEYKFTTLKNKIDKTIRNTNSLVNSDKYKITGTKTGFLYEAGHCLMIRAAAKDSNVIAITFGADSKSTSISETAKLLDYGLDKLCPKGTNSGRSCSP